MEKEIPKMRLVTISSVSERFKVVASIARQIIRYFASIEKVLPLDAQHQQCLLYTGADKKELVKEKEE